ncbi:MAG: GTP cyclohydrolase, partial [Bosea sp.]|nr:GTP cyclohydrolase [Bosea sp. (in: a-proteobacteria)]
MPKSRTLFGRPGETEIIAVDRALAEFRAGRPVLLRDGENLALALSAELADADIAGRLDTLAEGNARLVLSAARLRRLGAKGRSETGVLAMPMIDIARVEALTLKIDARVDAPVGPANALDAAALELAGLALVLPAIILVPVTATQIAGEPLVEVAITAINGYRAAQVATLAIVGRAPVPLEGAPDTEFV